MKRASNLKLIIFFTLLTFLLTAVVVFAWEKVLLPPFYSWVERKYPGEEYSDQRWKIQQRVEHFFISITVDLIVVTLLLWLVDRKQRKLVDSEARYRTLIEHANDGIGIVTAADHRLVEANNRFCEILGLPATELLGRNVCALLPVVNEEGKSTERLAKLLDDTESGEQELRVRTPKGALLPVSVSFSKLATGKESLIVLIIRDLSVRQRLELEKAEIQHQLFQASKLTSLGELSAGVAHEINNPLNGIINFAQLLKDEATARSEFERRMIDGIIDEGGRIAKIVRGLLTFAYHDGQELALVHISEVINSSIALFGYQLSKDGIQVEIDVEENLPAVKADASRLRQVAVNMISNAHHALKAKTDEPSIPKVFCISARRIERKDGSIAVRLEFYDNGVGIRPEDTAKVFDPFFTTRRDTGGTGLGLSISFGIVRDHGGMITVESEAGSYTRFIVELPAAEEAEIAYAKSFACGR